MAAPAPRSPRDGPRRARQRHGRLDPHPRERVRARRAQADTGAQHARSRLRRVLGDDDARARADPHPCATPRPCSTRPRAPASGDPYTAPPPSRPFADEVGADPGRLRIGFRTRRRDGERGRARLRRRGAHGPSRCSSRSATTSSPSSSPRSTTRASRRRSPASSACSSSRDLERWSRKLGRELEPSDLDPWNQGDVRDGRGRHRRRSTRPRSSRLRRYARGVAQWWADGWDVLVTPQLTCLPPRLGELAPDNDPLENLARIAGMTDFTMPFNVTGSARDVAPAPLERRRASRRRAVRRRLRPRGRRAPARGSARAGATVGRPPPAGVGLIAWPP